MLPFHLSEWDLTLCKKHWGRDFCSYLGSSFKLNHFLSFKWRFLSPNPSPQHTPQSHKIVFLHEWFISLYNFFCKLSFCAYETKENLIQKIKNTFLPTLITMIKNIEPYLNNELREIKVCLSRYVASSGEHISLAPNLTGWSLPCHGLHPWAVLSAWEGNDSWLRNRGPGNVKRH